MTQAREVNGQNKDCHITLSEAKKWLRVLEDDKSEDDLIRALMNSATDYVETFLNKSVSLTLFVWNFSDFEDVIFKKYPFHSIAKVEYLNGAGVATLLSSDKYEVSYLSSEDACIKFLEKPSTFSRLDGSKKYNTVSVFFRCGYETGNAPASIKIALRLLVCKWYDNREDGKQEKVTAVENILSPLRNINF